jgi:hypothetical protein
LPTLGASLQSGDSILARQPKYKNDLAQEWAGPIMAALELNAAKLGTPEGSLSDFIRLIKMTQELLEVEETPPVCNVVWLDGWHTEADFPNSGPFGQGPLEEDPYEDEDEYKEQDDYGD